MSEEPMEDDSGGGGASLADREAHLFESLCELEAEARIQQLSDIERADPPLASRLRRLLAIDEVFGTHTARSVVADAGMRDPVADIVDVGAFRLVRQIGRGGMGVVYLAERRNDFGQQVAIKIMPRFAIDDRSRERFAQERRILAQLRHPNICTIVDGGELAEGTPWLAMEYVPGESLCTWCERTGAGLHERIALFLQLCDAVQYAHRNLVIHRDLKDSNVLVDESGTLKLLDFGIAKSLTTMADGGHTAAQDRFFSPMTAAPEQLRGERATVAVDVYALGVLLHQLLCGVLPFARPHRDPADLQRAILEAVPPKMSTVVLQVTAEQVKPDVASLPVTAQALRGELDAIASHCLRKGAAERYAEVGDLARDLRAWLSGHPISLSGGDRLYRLKKFVHRNRVGVAVAMLATTSMLMALAIALWQSSELRTQRDAAQAARMRSETDRDRARVVADFMRTTFEQADPGKASDGGLLARELIARGKRRLHTLNRQKGAQAELALLLAESDANLGLLRESEATFLEYAQGIEALAAADADARWRLRRLRLSNALTLEKDDPQLDAALAALAPLAQTPEQHVTLARLQERLLVRRSDFERAVLVLENAWHRHGDALEPATALQLQIDLGNALLSTRRNEDARRLCDGIDRDALRAHDPALQIRAFKLIARELQRRKNAKTELTRAVEQWRRTAEHLYGEDSLEAAKAYEWTVGVSVDTQEQIALMEKAYAIQRTKLPAVSIGRAYAEYNMADFHLDLRKRPDLAEPHLREAVRIGRQATSRSHGDVRLFELTWAETLNALGRYRVSLEQLSAPPGDPADTEDAERLSALRLELARAATALDRPTDARTEIAAVHALWQRLGTPLPKQLANGVRDIETRLGGGRDGL